jgi:hypothetical protein
MQTVRRASCCSSFDPSLTPHPLGYAPVVSAAVLGVLLQVLGVGQLKRLGCGEEGGGGDGGVLTSASPGQLELGEVAAASGARGRSAASARARRGAAH